jgi:flavin-dependent dehydrogenase
MYYRDNVIAIGDAVSTVNCLGGEGIRHAMHGAEIACKHIQPHLDHRRPEFQADQAEMYSVFLRTWNLSEKLGKKKYLQDSDVLVDKMVTYLRPLSLADVVDILFFYRFEKSYKGLPRYLRMKLNACFTRLRARLRASAGRIVLESRCTSSTFNRRMCDTNTLTFYVFKAS